MSPTSTTTFHPFPLLPLELRLQIWESTITARTVSLRVGTHWHPLTARPASRLLPSSSSTPTCAPPPPALLHTCRESREVGLKTYTQALFSEWDTDRARADVRCPEPLWRPARRYLWVNFDLDTIDVGHGGLGMQFVEKYKRQIRRLRMECDKTSTVGRQEFRLLRGRLQTGEYERLREVEVVVRDDVVIRDAPDAWFPESWRGDGVLVEGWRLDVRNWEDGRGYILLMERMGGDDGACG